MSIDVSGGSIELTVLGGPSTIEVDVDFGATGVRGSKIWSAAGDPSTFTPPSPYEIRLGDMYINIDPGSSEYGYMYSYEIAVGSPAWVEVLKLSIPQYSDILSTTFTSGTNSADKINIPVSNLTTDSGTVKGSYAVTYNIENSNPVASGFSYDIVEVTGVDNIQITINAKEYVTSSWSDLSGVKNVHVHITYLG